MNERRVSKLADAMEERYPKAFRAAYPRNIVVPGGYTDPRVYASVLVSHLRVVQYREMNELAHRTAYGISLMLMANRVPTYFVADEFATAVANTDLPGDFKFAELNWPMEAQVFVLSDKFCQGYYGHTGAPFLSIGRFKAGMYPHVYPKMPSIDIPLPSIENQADRLLMDYTYFGSEVPVTYNAAYPLNQGIELFKDAPWNDATIFEHAYHGLDFTPKGSLEKEQEEDFVQKAQQLGVKLVLTLAELPAMREEGKVTRHAIVTQQGKVKLPQLYSANIVGRTYRIPRKYSTEGGSTRAKPRFKYRRGHRVWQSVLYKDKAAEFVSVSQMPKKPDGFIDFDAAGPELQAKFYACHKRIWVEGFFFEDQEDTDKKAEKGPDPTPP